MSRRIAAAREACFVAARVARSKVGIATSSSS